MSIKEYVVSHLVNLIKIKSVLTLALTTAFVMLALRGEIAPDQFLTIFTMVVGFYFGTQNSKSEESVAVIEDPIQTAEASDTSTNVVYTPIGEDEYHEN